MAGVSFRSPVSRELHLQPEVSDERGLAVHSLATYDAAAGHKDEQVRSGGRIKSPPRRWE
jgi:hypothetical protein